MRNDKPDKLMKDLESLSIELDNLADLGPGDNSKIDTGEDNLSPDELGHHKAELETTDSVTSASQISETVINECDNNPALHHELLIAEIVEQSLPAIELQLKTRLRSLSLEEIESLYNDIHAKS